MRVVVTRPLTDGERTAANLRAFGHHVLVAPLMRVEPVPADLDGKWSGIIITSANAPAAIGDNPARSSLTGLPVFAVGQRSAQAAQHAGFVEVMSSDGDVHDLVDAIAARPTAALPLLYLAGENRAADLVGELSNRGIAVDQRVVYRTVTAPFPLGLIEALRAGEVDAILHFSRRSAATYITAAEAAGLLKPAMAVQHFCLSAQVAEPLAGASRIKVADRADEASLIALLGAPA
jgi:uroporphyrinogen-III synthase